MQVLSRIYRHLSVNLFALPLSHYGRTTAIGNGLVGVSAAKATANAYEWI